METITVTGPAYWASALVNGDDSSFDVMGDEDAAAEREALSAWLDSLPEGAHVVDVARDDDGDAVDPHFTWSFRLYGGTAAGGDVIDYVVVIHN